MTDTVIYDVDHDQRALAAVYQSIESLRTHNQTTPILLYAPEAALPDIRAQFLFAGLEAWPAPTSLPAGWAGARRVWRMPSRGGGASAVDAARNAIFADVAKIFALIGGAVLASQHESLTAPGVATEIFYCDLLDRLMLRHHCRSVPVLNPDLLLADRAGMKLLQDGVEFLTQQRNALAPALDLLGFADPRLIDAVLLAVYLGKMPPMPVHLLSSALVPYFYQVSNQPCAQSRVAIYYGDAHISLRRANPYAAPEGSLPAHGTAAAALP